jgi:hypothetical protein
MYQIYIKIKQRQIFVVLLLQLVTIDTLGLFCCITVQWTETRSTPDIFNKR